MYSMNEEEKRQWIQERLDKIFLEKNKSSILALDLEINMLVCASQSYKHESVLKPFPSTLLSDSNNDKNYELLVRTLLSLPPVLDWRLKLKSFKTDQLNLVYWLLANRSYDLEYNTTLDQGKLKELSKYSHDFSKPTHVFEIKYTEEKEKRFDQLKEQTKLVLNADDAISSLSFHGTRMDNVYSIMHTGLLAHLNKNGLFGEGTYLSQEPSISLHYSPSCKSWENSLIGQRMSCLLVCETINDPKHVKIGINDQPTAQNSKSDQCKNSNNNLPEKYFIVKNNDYVRVRYLLIYAEKSKPKRKNKLVRLFNENRFALLLISYSLLLIFVGLLNSRVFHKYVKLSYRKLTDYFTSTFSSSSSYE